MQVEYMMDTLFNVYTIQHVIYIYTYSDIAKRPNARIYTTKKKLRERDRDTYIHTHTHIYTPSISVLFNNRAHKVTFADVFITMDAL